MSGYDIWKTTNPADALLGNEYEDDMETTDEVENTFETPQIAPVAQLPTVKGAPVPDKPKEPKPRASRRSDDVRTVSEIASAIAKITSEVGVVQKQGENRFHGYKYARMSDVLVKLTPLLAKHGIVIFQTELERSNFDDGRVLAVQYEFTIAHSSGEVWPEKPRQTGVCRARDSKGGWDDKAFNKCHTAARKYFLLALFQVATSDEEDADEDRGQERSGPRRAASPAPNVMRKPGYTVTSGRGGVSVAGGVAYDAQTGEVYDERNAEAPMSKEEGRAAILGIATQVAKEHNAAVVAAHADSGVPAATQPAAEAVPAQSQPLAGTASDPKSPTMSEQIQAEYSRCQAAAEEGMAKLRAVWNTVPPILRGHLENAKERRWKPRAKEVDAANTAAIQ